MKYIYLRLESTDIKELRPSEYIADITR